MKYILNAFMVFGLATALHAQDIKKDAFKSQDQTGTLPGFDYRNPLLKLHDPQFADNNTVRYSALTGYLEGVKPIQGQFNSNFGAVIDKEKGTHRISMYNLSILEMFTHGLRRPEFVVLEVKDPAKYRYLPEYGDEQEWLRKNGWCYELLMPVGVIKGISIVDQELEKYFNVKCSNAKKMMKVQVKDQDGNLKDEMREVEVLVIKEL